MSDHAHHLDGIASVLTERLAADGVSVRRENDRLTLVDAQLPPGTSRELTVAREGGAFVLSARDPQGGESVQVARADSEDEAVRACVHWFDDPQ